LGIPSTGLDNVFDFRSWKNPKHRKTQGGDAAMVYGFWPCVIRLPQIPNPAIAELRLRYLVQAVIKENTGVAAHGGAF